jgi:glycosyltransferase involved in cell wall biosynthesis
MRIFVTGTRGIPDISGGVEKHCQQLYPLVAGLGHEVIVATRKNYVKNPGLKKWKGVRLVHTYAPESKSLEAIVHTFLCVLKARHYKPDILHIHAVGPGLMVPLARVLGFKVVVTNHGPDYARQKWGKAARAMLRLGEWLAGRFAHEVIVISRPIQDIVRQRCGRDAAIIPNGVCLPEKTLACDEIENMGLEPEKYVLAVARFVPEKGLDLLIEAFEKLGNARGYKLVIAGDADHESRYSRALKKRIADNPEIVGTGYITGEKLNQVYSHAALFVLPSYHEGLPISLLEAMSYGLPVLVSDIAANREVGLDERRYFKCGDVGDLAEKLSVMIDQGVSEEEKAWFRKEIAEKYDWGRIAGETVRVYKQVQGSKFKVQGGKIRGRLDL